MPNYKDPQSKVHFIESADFAHLLPAGSVPISDVEASALNQPTTAQLWAAHQAAAQTALDKSDITIGRCYENAVAVPAEWKAYRTALRAIVAASTGDPTQPLPTRPAYPAGT